MNDPSFSDTAAEDKTAVAYIVLADKSEKVILSTNDYHEAVRMANLIRRAGGEVTVFRSLKS